MKRRTGPPSDNQEMALETTRRRPWWPWGLEEPPTPEQPLRPEIELQEKDPFLPRCDTMQTLQILQSQPQERSLLAQDDSDDDEEEKSLLTVSSLNDNHIDDDESDHEEEEEEDSLVEESSKTKKTRKELDVDAYMADREMTPRQERANALTMIPSPLYCVYYLLAGKWLSDALAQEIAQASSTPIVDERLLGTLGTPFNALFADENGCVRSSWFPNLHALPPLPLVMVAAGITLHAPFSFLYHWKYAHSLPAGRARTEHWSRRMDQGMIHICSAFLSFATSGSWDFFLVNLCFNLDCIYRHFKTHQVRPRNNQYRIVISVIAYSIPLLKSGEFWLFARLWFVIGLSFYIFSKYPFGGWSHSVFHIVAAFCPPLLMIAAQNVPASQGQMRVAAQCAVLAKQTT